MSAAAAGAQAAESLALDLWAPDEGVFAAVRAQGGQLAGALALDGEALPANRAELTEHAARIETDPSTVEVVLRAGAQSVTTVAGGVPRAAQSIEFEGTVTRPGGSTRVRGHGVLARLPVENRETARRRCVVAVTDDGAFVQIVALRAGMDAPHGDETVSALATDMQSGNVPHDFEEVRLSTVYRSDGLPRIAGAELYRPGDEFPARLSGEALANSVVALDGRTIVVSFFRWTYVGRPGWGSYEIEPAP